MTFSDDSDLDALLDAQSSDEDDGDEQGGGRRRIDDILKDFDEFGLDEVDPPPSVPRSEQQQQESAGGHATHRRPANNVAVDQFEGKEGAPAVALPAGGAVLEEVLRRANSTEPCSLDSQDEGDDVMYTVLDDAWELEDQAVPPPETASSAGALDDEKLLTDLAAKSVLEGSPGEGVWTSGSVVQDAQLPEFSDDREDGLVADSLHVGALSDVQGSVSGISQSRSEALGREDGGISEHMFQSTSTNLFEGDRKKEQGLSSVGSKEYFLKSGDSKVSRRPGAAFAAAAAASRLFRSRMIADLETSTSSHLSSAQTPEDESSFGDTSTSVDNHDLVEGDSLVQSLRDSELTDSSGVPPFLSSNSLNSTRRKDFVVHRIDEGDSHLVTTPKESSESSYLSDPPCVHNIEGDGGPQTFSMINVPYARPQQSSSISHASLSRFDPSSKDDSTAAEGAERQDVDVAPESGNEERLVPEMSSSDMSGDDAANYVPSLWETTSLEGSDVAVEELQSRDSLSVEATKMHVVDGSVEGALGVSRQEECMPLATAEEFERRAASSGFHLEEGAAAQPMRLEGIHSGPPAIGVLQLDSGGRLSQALGNPAIRRDHGYPQALAVHSSSVAVGMSKGCVMVSNANGGTSDSSESKARFLGAGDKSLSAVSAMCFNLPGDMLLVGYSNGSVLLWDLTRASASKSVTTEHTAAVIHAVILQDSRAGRQMRAITGDCKGNVLVHTITIVPLLRHVSVTTQCLLDGRVNGLALSVSVQDEAPHANGVTASSHSVLTSNSIGLNTMMGGVAGVVGGVTDVGRKASADEGGGLVVLVTQQISLVVRLPPTLEVCAKFTRPQSVRETAIPYTAWRPNNYGFSKGSQTGVPPGLPMNAAGTGLAVDNTGASNTSEKHVEKDVLPESGKRANMGRLEGQMVPTLAMAWDHKAFVMQLFESELKVTAEWDLHSTAAGVAWLEEQMVVVLTVDNQLRLFTVEGFEVDRATLGGEQGDEAVAYLTHLVNPFGNPERTYHSSLAVRGAALYLLGHSQLWRTCLLPWRNRIKALQDAGDWMGAFHIAMELYDGKARGVTGLPRSLDARRTAIMPTLLSLLSAYIDEAFAYLSLAFRSSVSTKSNGGLSDLSAAGNHEVQAIGHSSPSSASASDVKDQYARVGGVAIEFCVHIKKTDVLFENVFAKFDAVGQRGSFLELLEPYILKDMLGGLAPEVMQGLVEHYSDRGWLQRVEQCILHMDIGSLDFNQVVRLCREHGLYSALIYIFNKGLDDFRSPLEELLTVAQDLQNPQCQAFGYKLLVYLKYCFLGLSFPPGRGELSPARLPSLRAELLQFLLDPVGSNEDQAVMRSKNQRGKTYPRLCFLLELDTKATLLVLSLAFPESGPLGVGKVGCAYSAGQQEETSQVEDGPNAGEASPYMQAVVNALVHVLEAAQCGLSATSKHESEGSESASHLSWPSKEDASCLLQLVARFVAARHAVVASNTLCSILENLTSSVELSRQDDKARIEKEGVMLELLQGLPETEWDVARTLKQAQQAQFWQVSALIHRKSGDMITALDCYLLDVNHPQHAFTFIMDMLHPEDGLEGSNMLSFREGVLSRIAKLLALSRPTTLLIVLKYFIGDLDSITTSLGQEPYLLFSYLKAIMDVRTHGYCQPLPSLSKQASEETVSTQLETLLVQDKDVNLADMLEQSGLLSRDGLAELYLELLCQFHPTSVLSFLERSENYRLEHCLKLCQEYEITDAAVFILERVGDVASALSLVLSEFEQRLREMDQAVSCVFSSVGSSKRHVSILHGPDLPEVELAASVMRDAIRLCQRNALQLDLRESKQLWFRVLDRVVDPLCSLSMSEETIKFQEQTLGQHEKGTFHWNVVAGRPSGEYVRKHLRQFMGEIVESMKGYVPLSDIMQKILTDNGGHEFRDFRETILGLLSTYGFECALLGKAKRVLEDDTYSNISTLKKYRTHAYAPSGINCCVCQRKLNEDRDRSSDGNVVSRHMSSKDKLKGKMTEEESREDRIPSLPVGVFIFACGHAVHSSCLDDTVNGESQFIGCPICYTSGSDNEAVVQRQTVQQPRTRQKLRGMETTTVGSEAKTSSVFSRWEVLNSLQKGKGIDELGPSIQLSLAPPKLNATLQKGGTIGRTIGPSRATSSSRKAGASVRSSLKRDLGKPAAARPRQRGIRDAIAGTPSGKVQVPSKRRTA